VPKRGKNTSFLHLKEFFDAEAIESFIHRIAVFLVGGGPAGELYGPNLKNKLKICKIVKKPEKTRKIDLLATLTSALC